MTTTRIQGTSGGPESGSGFVRVFREHPVLTTTVAVGILVEAACSQATTATPTLEAPVTKTSPIQMTEGDKSLVPADIRTQLKDVYGGYPNEYYIFTVGNSTMDGYSVDSSRNNASSLAFSMYTLDNGKSAASFADSSGAVHIGEVTTSTRVYDDGSVYQVLKVTYKDEQGQDKTLDFMGLGFGKLTDTDFANKTPDELNKLATDLINAGNIEQVSIGNPLLNFGKPDNQKQPDSITWLKQDGGQSVNSDPWVTKLKTIFNFGVIEAHAAGLGDLLTPTAPAQEETPVSSGSEQTSATNEITGTDYSTGKESTWTLKPETVTESDTADWHFKRIKTADAVGENGETFKVVWNPDSGRWIRVTEVNTDLKDYNHLTHFNNIDLMVKSGDLDLILLAQGNFAEAFPKSAIDPQFWVNVEEFQLQDHSGKLFVNFFLDLNNTFGGRSGSTGQSYDSTEVRAGYFDASTKPYRYAAIIDGTTSDNKQIKVVPKLNKNTDGTNFFEPLGLDEREFQLMISEGQKDTTGATLLERAFALDGENAIPVISLPESLAPWNNIHNAGGFGDGFHFSVDLELTGNYQDDVIVDMQSPGALFNLLPADVQLQVTNNINQLKTLDNPTKGFASGIPFMSFRLTNGITPDLAQMLSRNINLTAFTDDGLKTRLK